jgi:uncharacterized protein YndB with AHSA1/START domain
METKEKTKITVQTTVKRPVADVWSLWNEPKHITKWCSATEEWHTPRAENDLREGGKFLSRMEAKDGSFGFDFGGTYDKVTPNKTIAYTMGDGRKCEIDFTGMGNETSIVETFEAESQNPVEMQKGGWQAILDNFRKYAESGAK